MCSPRHWMAAGWNACSSCHGDSGRARKYLVLPCVGSGRVYGERIGATAAVQSGDGRVLSCVGPGSVVAELVAAHLPCKLHLQGAPCRVRQHLAGKQLSSQHCHQAHAQALPCNELMSHGGMSAPFQSTQAHAL